MNNMDRSIQLVSILFVLSIISERIANFIKLQMDNTPCLRRLFKIGLGVGVRYDSAAQEKQRELQILKINLLCGFFTAVILNANIIKIIGNIDTSAIGWDKFSLPVPWPKWGLLILEWLFTGAFISVGSKFWHDLLDLLLEIKRNRQLINDGTQQQNTFGDFTALSTSQQQQLMENAMHTKSDEWFHMYSGLTGIMAGTKTANNSTTKQQAIIFQVQQKTSNPQFAVPTSIFYNGYNIPTDVIECGKTKFLSFPGDPANMEMGAGISPEYSDTTPTGTAGFKGYATVDGVQKNYIVTCYHVAFLDQLISKNTSVAFNDASKTVQVFCPGYANKATPAAANIVGKAAFGMLNTFVDIALVEISDTYQVTGKIHGLNAPQGIYTPTKQDENTLHLFMCGTISGNQSSILRCISSAQQVPNPGDDYLLYSFQGVYAADLFTAAGDSGAAVVDDQNRLIGIVFSADNKYTYIIPVQFIINNINQTSLNFSIAFK